MQKSYEFIWKYAQSTGMQIESGETYEMRFTRGGIFWFSRCLHHTFHICEGIGGANSSFQLVSLSLVLVLLHLCP